VRFKIEGELAASDLESARAGRSTCEDSSGKRGHRSILLPRDLSSGVSIMALAMVLNNETPGSPQDKDSVDECGAVSFLC
jgi:hypothetical protein